LIYGENRRLVVEFFRRHSRLQLDHGWRVFVIFLLHVFWVEHFDRKAADNGDALQLHDILRVLEKLLLRLDRELVIKALLGLGRRAAGAGPEVLEVDRVHSAVNGLIVVLGGRGEWEDFEVCCTLEIPLQNARDLEKLSVAVGSRYASQQRRSGY